MSELKDNQIREKLPSNWLYRRGKVFDGVKASWGMKGGDGQNTNNDFSTNDGNRVLSEALPSGGDA